MINGFEEETHELTEKELKLVQPIVNGLKTKIGEINAISGGKIIVAMRSSGYKIDASRLRKIIHHIRVKRLIEKLVSTNKGYYIATTDEELKKYVESLNQRINSIVEVRQSFLV
jgi:rRNA-processing protein FCF1